LNVHQSIKVFLQVGQNEEKEGVRLGGEKSGKGEKEREEKMASGKGSRGEMEDWQEAERSTCVYLPPPLLVHLPKPVPPPTPGIAPQPGCSPPHNPLGPVNNLWTSGYNNNQ
jgi:hypothetical protein